MTVKGTVTFNGEPVQTGHITLSPADGKGPQVGAEIKDGQFTLTNVLPGEKIVSVTGGGEIQFPKSSEEMAQMAARGEQIKVPPQIPSNAKGNNEKVTITGEPNQTLTITLSSPAT